MLRRIIVFVVAAALMVVAGSASHSYFVQRAWSGAAAMAGGGSPVSIPFGDRIAWAAHDLIGMIVGYSALTSIALLVAFLIAGALARFSGARTLIFGVAGAAAILALFTILRMVLGTVGIFGARGAAGLGGQMLVGFLAGVLFAQLTPPQKAARR
jgi:cellobiose-specific phosphotransferase system component IIC